MVSPFLLREISPRSLDDVVAVPRPLLDDFTDHHIEMAAHKAFSAEAATPAEYVL
jgi:hypothetical protein